MNKIISTGLALAAAAGGLAAAGVAYAYAVEPYSIQFDHLTIRLPGAAGRLPAGGLRILQLTDSHFGGRDERERRKIEIVRQLTAGLEYDLLVHTGDFIHYDAGLENAMTLLRAVPAPRMGRFAVLGNHDYVHYAMEKAVPNMFRTWLGKQRADGRAAWTIPFRMPGFVQYVRHTPLAGPRKGPNNVKSLTCRLQEEGFTVLQNCALPLVDRERGLDLWLAGVDDVTQGWPRLGYTLESVPDGAPVVLLSHNPDIIASPELGRVGLVISGHTHGGQIVAPLWGPAHTQSWYLQRSEVSGLVRRGETQIYISRGIGEGLPLRFRARPQLTLITVTGG